MKPLVTAILLGGSMALSALTLLVSGCLKDPFSASSYAPEDNVCCSAGTYYYACEVEVEQGAGYTAVPVTGCYASPDQGDAEARAQVQATTSGTVRATTCDVAACPGTGSSGAGGSP